MLRFILGIASLCLLCGCEHQSANQDAINELAQGLKRTLEDAKSVLKSGSNGAAPISRQTAGEIKRLLAVEYRVEEWPSLSDRNSAQSTLSKLGRDGWDCFSIQDNGRMVRAYCKRDTSNYLRYAAPLLSGLAPN